MEADAALDPDGQSALLDQALDKDERCFFADPAARFMALRDYTVKAGCLSGLHRSVGDDEVGLAAARVDAGDYGLLWDPNSTSEDDCAEARERPVHNRIQQSG